MTIEFSLRRRATVSRCFALTWIVLATIILVGAYFSLPKVTSGVMKSIRETETPSAPPNLSAKTEGKDDSGIFSGPRLLEIVTMGLGLSLIVCGCLLLGRAAFVEIELAARLNGLADALCISGGNFEQLERSVAILVPKARYLSSPEIVSVKALKVLSEIVKPGK